MGGVAGTREAGISPAQAATGDGPPTARRANIASRSAWPRGSAGGRYGISDNRRRADSHLRVVQGDAVSSDGDGGAEAAELVEVVLVTLTEPLVPGAEHALGLQEAVPEEAGVELGYVVHLVRKQDGVGVRRPVGACAGIEQARVVGLS